MGFKISAENDISYKPRLKLHTCIVYHILIVFAHIYRSNLLVNVQ